MRRRTFISLLGGAAAWPLTARAQQPAMPVIGFLRSTSLADAAHLVTAFRQGLKEAGFIEGQNVAIEYRWSADEYDRLPAFVTEFVSRKVDVIAATGPSSMTAKAATSTIPIVFTSGSDPVADGRVVSLARPGGNLTGVSFLTVELNPKRFELISEMVPQARTIGLLFNPNQASTETVIRQVAAAAKAKSIELKVLDVSAGVDCLRKDQGPLHRAMRIDRIMPELARAHFFGTGLAASVPNNVMAFLKSDASSNIPDVQLLLRVAPMNAGPYLAPFRQAYPDGFGCRPTPLPSSQSVAKRLMTRVR